MSESRHAEMVGADGEILALESVQVAVDVVGLYVTMQTEQRYTNPTDDVLAVTYTFPLPSETTLLGVEFEVRGKQFVGAVHPLPEARRRKQQAIDAGDTALLIQVSGDWYTAELGNVGAGETVVVRIKSGNLVVPIDGVVRYAVPTTIAPHYGDPRTAGLTAETAPVTSMAVVYPFSYRATIYGSIPTAVTVPTHVALVQAQGDTVTVEIQGATMDRDVVLTIAGYAEYQASLVAERDGQHWYATYVKLPAQAGTTDVPMHVKLLVDCSGSMGGTSIQQARAAVTTLLSALRDGDSIAVTRFGSTVVDVTPGLMTVGPTIRKQMQKWVAGMNADLGGTETVQGLTHVLAMPTDDKPCVVVLLTDGEAYGVEEVVTQLKQYAHAVYPIIIGHVPSTGGLGRLATRTGGFCESVTPNERIDAAMARMIRRIRSVPVVDAALEHASPRQMWQQGALARYAGEYSLVTGASADPVAQVLRVEQVQTPIAVHPVPAALQSDFVRTVAATHLDGLANQTKVDWALLHQLVCAETAYVAVATHADDAKVVGKTIQAVVEQQMAAGWHGLEAHSVLHSAPSVVFSAIPSSMPQRRARPGIRGLYESPRRSMSHIEYEAVDDAMVDMSANPSRESASAVSNSETLEAAFRILMRKTSLDQIDLAALQAAGVPDDLIDACRAITGYSEKQIIHALAYLVLGERAAKIHGVAVDVLPPALLGGLRVVVGA